MEAAAPNRERESDSSQPTPLSEELTHDLDRDELSRLVRAANDAGMSYQQMASRAIDPKTGDQASKPYLQKLATNAIATAPGAPRLRAIAAALSRPESLIQRAAAIQFLDYQATELSGYDDDVRVIVAHLAGMPPGEKRKWRAMMEAAERVESDLP